MMNNYPDYEDFDEDEDREEEESNNEEIIKHLRVVLTEYEIATKFSHLAMNNILELSDRVTIGQLRPELLEVKANIDKHLIRVADYLIENGILSDDELNVITKYRDSVILQNMPEGI